MQENNVVNSAGERAHWSSRWAFFLVTIGSAVGLGNIWKFPYMTGQNGGSAFVLVYLVCILVIGLPLLMAELTLGRRGQSNPIETMGLLAKEAGVHKIWKTVGVIGVGTALLILSFYSVVAGWILEYTAQAIRGFDGITPESAGANFTNLLTNPIALICWHTVFMAMTVAVVARGVTSGIETANKVLMPALFIILLVLVGYGFVSADMGAAFRFMFHFDLKAINSEVILSAMGHAFFTLSLGMGTIMAYGSYLNRGQSIAGTCLQIAIADTAVALLAGLAIFSVVFANGMAPAAGPGLLLQTLPIAFSKMPFGHLMAVFFFILVVFAAWTSSISLLEPFVALLTEKLGVRRTVAAWSTGAGVWLLGIAVSLSFNEWSGFKLFGMGLFDQLDSLTSKILMPLGGLLVAIFAGWIMKCEHLFEEVAMRTRGFQVWRILLRYVSPIAITMIFLHVTGIMS